MLLLGSAGGGRVADRPSAFTAGVGPSVGKGPGPVCRQSGGKPCVPSGSRGDIQPFCRGPGRLSGALDVCSSGIGRCSLPRGRSGRPRGCVHATRRVP